MKKLMIIALLAVIAIAGACCSCEEVPQTGSGENILDPEVIPEQDTDLYPDETSENRFAVSGVFGNNMVVQQNRELSVWGQGPTGMAVRVSVSWSSRTFTSRVNGRGEWRIRLNVPPAPKGNPEQTITIVWPSNKITYTGVLIGEVWMCSGQSNMQMALRRFQVGDVVGHPGVEDQEEVIAASDAYPALRMFTSALVSSDSPEWNCSGTGWKVCSSSTSGNFSAVAYFFGKTLLEKLDVPVGLIVNAYGGAPAQTYLPVGALDADAELKAKYMEPFRANPEAYRAPGIPGGLWNAMVNPFLKCSVRGMIWYQGESNWQDYAIYDKLMKALIREWRRGFGQGDFPHYYVQIAASYQGLTGPAQRIPFWDKYAYIRESQAKIRTQNNNCEMVTTMDTGDPDDVHPMKKREVGERLARIALNRDYGRKDVRYLGPRYRSHTVDGNRVTLLFDHADGLRTSNGISPKHFYIAGDDRKFYLADATIEGNKVVLANYAVQEPVAVRYAFISAPVTNLENGCGLPAEPFRTDAWLSVTYNLADMKTEKPY